MSNHHLVGTKKAMTLNLDCHRPWLMIGGLFYIRTYAVDVPRALMLCIASKTSRPPSGRPRKNAPLYVLRM